MRYTSYLLGISQFENYAKFHFQEKNILVQPILKHLNHPKVNPSPA